MASDEPGSNGWYDRSSYYGSMNSKVMLAAVLALVVVIIIVVILHIFARFVLRRRALAAQQRLGNRVMQIHSSEPPKTGLDPLIIATLPMFIFKQENPNEESYYTAMDVIECAVCLSMLEEEEMARLLPNCKHIFHVECIDKWLCSHSTCPICRAEAEPMVHPQPAAGNDGAPQMGPASDGVAVGESSNKPGGLGSRMSSFRRILSRERSSRRIQYCAHEGVRDLERQ